LPPAPVALDKGRRLLESLPYPENLDHHFVVDPMTLGVNEMAEHLADEVIRAH
jgi:hypothetical protein